MRQANIPACLIFTATGFQRRLAKEAAWLNGKNGKNRAKSKKLLTGVGLLMEGVGDGYTLVSFIKPEVDYESDRAL